jgi:hypothetical protein
LNSKLLYFLIIVTFSGYAQTVAGKCKVTVQVIDINSGKPIKGCTLHYQISAVSNLIKAPINSLGSATLILDTGLVVELSSACDCYFDSRYELIKVPEKDTVITLKQSNIVYDQPNHLLVLAFKNNSIRLTKYGTFFLDEFYRTMMRYPKISIEIQGYAYFKNDSIKSQRISLIRAKIIYQELVKRGVPDYRLKYVGLGSLKDVNTIKPKEIRKLNSKIKILIHKENVNPTLHLLPKSQ